MSIKSKRIVKDVNLAANSLKSLLVPQQTALIVSVRFGSSLALSADSIAVFSGTESSFQAL